MAYQIKTWNKGDVITSENLNKMEAGIAAATAGLKALSGTEYNGNASDFDAATIAVSRSFTLKDTTIEGTLVVNGNTNFVKDVGVGDALSDERAWLSLAHDPVNESHATHKKYVDDAVKAVSNALEAATKTDGTYNAETNKLATVSTVENKIGTLDVRQMLIDPDHTLKTLSETDGKIAASFQQISIKGSAITDLNTYLDPKANIAGATFTGDVALSNGKNLTLATEPTENMHAATKAYVDTAKTNAIDSAIASAKTYTDNEVAKKASLSSAAFTGNITYTGTLNHKVSVEGEEDQLFPVVTTETFTWDNLSGKPMVATMTDVTDIADATVQGAFIGPVTISNREAGKDEITGDEWEAAEASLIIGSTSINEVQLKQLLNLLDGGEENG